MALADTGQTLCYADEGVLEPCPDLGESYFGQDGSHLGKPMDFTDNDDGTVTDNVTGLVWAKCSAGQNPTDCTGFGAALEWQEAMDYCANNTDGLPGDGWRLPSRLELLSMTDFQKPHCIDKSVFGGEMNAGYWTSSTSGNPNAACGVSFGTCASSCSYLKDKLQTFARCVRGAPKSSGDFETLEDGTVRDHATKLQWQQSSSAQQKSWQDALSYCETLELAGYVDWRLPNAKEAATLVDFSAPNPNLSEFHFPEEPIGQFWTSTTFKSWTSRGFALYGAGQLGDFGDIKTKEYHVRCVRDFCIPDCDGKECGDDGCGGSCGECGAGIACLAGSCSDTGAVYFDGNTHMSQQGTGVVGAKTYSLWFYAPDVQASQVLLIKKDTPGVPAEQRPVKMWLADGILTMRTIYQIPAIEDIVAEVGVQPSTWHHVVFQVSESKAELFLDGKKVDSSVLPGDPIDNGQDYTIGAAPQISDYQEFFTGYLYNVRIKPGFLYQEDFVPCEVDPLDDDSLLIDGDGTVPCACVPQCDGKECGDDGCGGSCGECGEGEVCDSPIGHCKALDVVMVPGGQFMMGCNAIVDPTCNQFPYHSVDVPAFAIGKFEVTVAEYADCVEAQSCSLPDINSQYCTWDVPGKEAYPVNCVNWEQANEYCQWEGKRLCSESEWEKAARGLDGRTYPWGNEAASCEYAVMVEVLYGCGTQSTMAVGSMPAGVSPYGAMDMSGNVEEWVEDCWHSDYGSAPIDGGAWIQNCYVDPQGAVHKVVRGGSFMNQCCLEASHRHSMSAQSGQPSVGFRCCESLCGDSKCASELNEDCGSCPADCSCAQGEICHEGTCCQPDCDGKECGEDGCGEVCGQCEGDQDACIGGACVCQPACEGKECGDSGCGGVCGVCSEGETCTGEMLCEFDPEALVWLQIPGGTFSMGCSAGDADCLTPDEFPAHLVEVSPFKMLRTEVTEAQYLAVAGENPSCDLYGGGGPNSPVECVSWFDADNFCKQIEGRLCSEAEWEYAARAGSQTKYYCGNDSTCLGDIAWYFATSGYQKRDVGGKAPNAFGLYDMLGNVWEWTADWFSGGYYVVSPNTDPVGPDSGSTRVNRGGGFYSSVQALRVSSRASNNPSSVGGYLGFRCCRSD